VTSGASLFEEFLGFALGQLLLRRCRQQSSRKGKPDRGSCEHPRKHITVCLRENERDLSVRLQFGFAKRYRPRSIAPEAAISSNCNPRRVLLSVSIAGQFATRPPWNQRSEYFSKEQNLSAISSL
jgi:hypothetical protein